MKPQQDLPAQYSLLFRFLRECTDVYSMRLTALLREEGQTVNAQSARFEIDVYFGYLLCNSLFSFQKREVGKEIADLYWTIVVTFYADEVTGDNLDDVISARFEEYRGIVNRCTASQGAPTMDLVTALRQHVLASAHDGKVQVEHPMLIGDFLRDTMMLPLYVQMDFLVTGGFGCGLKHILRASDDVRTMSISEMTRLCQAGQKEGLALAQAAFASPQPPVAQVKKQWWKPWA